MASDKGEKKIIVPYGQIVKKDEDDDKSGSGNIGPKADTYAKIIQGLGGNVDPNQLVAFSNEQEITKEAKKKSDRVTSQDLVEKKASEKEVEKRSEKEFEHDKEFAFKRSRGPGRP